MRKTMLVLMSLILTAAIASHASAFERVEATDDDMVNAGLIEGFHAIPKVGDLRGSVTSVYAGSAYALNRYVVVVGNAAAPCEGDDCMTQAVFNLGSSYKEPVKAVYSRQIDRNTYSIALIAAKLVPNETDMEVRKIKILLKVKFTKDGIASFADVTEVPLK